MPQQYSNDRRPVYRDPLTDLGLRTLDYSARLIARKCNVPLPLARVVAEQVSTTENRR